MISTIYLFIFFYTYVLHTRQRAPVSPNNVRMQNSPMMQSAEVDSYIFSLLFTHLVRFSFNRKMDRVEKKKRTEHDKQTFIRVFFLTLLLEI